MIGRFAVMVSQKEKREKRIEEVENWAKERISRGQPTFYDQISRKFRESMPRVTRSTIRDYTVTTIKILKRTGLMS